MNPISNLLTSRISVALAACFASLFALLAHAAPVKTPHVEAELIAQTTSASPGTPLQAALRLKIIDHWHTYWRNPGDSGLPTRLKWSLPEGYRANPIEWPYPKKLPLGPLMNFGYEGEVLHLVTIEVPNNAPVGKPVTLKAKGDWLVCADVCIPEEGEFTLTLPVTAGPGKDDPRWKKAFAQAKAAVPNQSLSNLSALVSGNTLTLSGAASALPAAGGVSFFPFEAEIIANAAPQQLTRSGDNFALTIKLAEPVNKELKVLEGVLVADESNAQFAAPVAAHAANIAAPISFDKSANTSKEAVIQPIAAGNTHPDLGLAFALLLAFAGGLVLNLMPCVFPVLGIKVMGFVQSAGADARVVRRQGLAFLGGVLVSFWVLAGAMLALRAFGESIGWGFQLQEPVFVVFLAMLFFAMALNLSGVFEIGTSVQSSAGSAEMQAQKTPLFGAFASGTLATLVATPCMAPGLGASVGFTLNQSPVIALVVFTAIALGLALPVVFLSFFPQWLRRLPKPGAWMETFKQLMAFPLYATCVWLIWVLGSQVGNDGVARLLFGLVLIALAAYAYGRLQSKRWRMAASLALVLVVVAGVIAAPPKDVATATPQGGATSNDWVPFSPEKVTALRAEGKGVFIDFTATWCITCQVNKRTSLNQADVVKHFAERNVVRMQADWTRKDPVITQTLASFGRNGVPLYVYYPAKGEPKVLPEVLTPALVIDAVK